MKIPQLFFFTQQAFHNQLSLTSEFTASVFFKRIRKPWLRVASAGQFACSDSKRILNKQKCLLKL